MLLRQQEYEGAFTDPTFTAAFEDFLLNYKSVQSDLDRAVQDLNIDGDDTSDEYDFMDDVAGGKEARQPNGQHKEPRVKYMDMLQKVADRELDEVTIELDDLDDVGSSVRETCKRRLIRRSTVRKELR